MTVAAQNIETYQGDNKEIIITVTDDDGVLIDLSGYSAVWCVYNQTLETIVIQKETGGLGITIPSPTSGQLVIELESTDTATLVPKNYGHQCEIKDASGNHSTVTIGYIKILRSITHAEL
jgi:hypothetical protein